LRGAYTVFLKDEARDWWFFSMSKALS
jgi:hypothetical protein